MFQRYETARQAVDAAVTAVAVNETEVVDRLMTAILAIARDGDTVRVPGRATYWVGSVIEVNRHNRGSLRLSPGVFRAGEDGRIAILTARSEDWLRYEQAFEPTMAARRMVVNEALDVLECFIEHATLTREADDDAGEVRLVSQRADNVPEA